MPSGKPTLRDVAKAAGVSPMTASNALHGKPGVKASTRAKELAVAEKLESRIHLTEKPLQLMRDIVKITEPGGHILDPFAGSGTTVLAAVQEGYTATGIEVTDTYAERARDRIRKALACAA